MTAWQTGLLVSYVLIGAMCFHLITKAFDEYINYDKNWLTYIFYVLLFILCLAWPAIFIWYSLDKVRKTNG